MSAKCAANLPWTITYAGDVSKIKDREGNLIGMLRPREADSMLEIFAQIGELDQKVYDLEFDLESLQAKLSRIAAQWETVKKLVKYVDQKEKIQFTEFDRTVLAGMRLVEERTTNKES